MKRKLILRLIFIAVPLIGAVIFLLFLYVVGASYDAVISKKNKTAATAQSSSQVSTANLSGNADGLAVSNNLIAFLKSWEGFSATGYEGADSWNITIGYGHVERSGETFTTLTQAEAQELLYNDLKSGYISSVQNEFASVTLKQNQIDALVSLCYNLGTNCWDGISLTNDIKKGANASTLQKDFEAVCYVGSSKSQGLLKRREAEWVMYSQGVYELNS
jgi:lysozyme